MTSILPRDIDLENKVFSRSIAKILTTCTCPRAGLALAAAARRSPLPLRSRARAQARVVDRSALERAVFMVLSPPRASHAFELTLPTAVLLTAASLQPCPSPASIRAARLRIVAPAELLCSYSRRPPHLPLLSALTLVPAAPIPLAESLSSQRCCYAADSLHAPYARSHVRLPREHRPRHSQWS